MSSLISVAIFGSRARGDFDINSDVDLLGISTSDSHLNSVNRNVRFSIYSKDTIEEMMRNGDLFALHLKKESIPLFNSHSYQKILNGFHAKSSYHDDVVKASIFGWILYDYIINKTLNSAWLNKKAAWCTRTILMARSADAGNAVFSKDELETFSCDKNAARLIENKDSKKKQKNLDERLNTFLKVWGSERPDWLENSNTIEEAINKSYENSPSNAALFGQLLNGLSENY